MDSVGIPWNCDIPVGIRRISLELMGESTDHVSLWWSCAVVGVGGCCGGSLMLVVSLCWCVEFVSCPGRLWLLVGMVGGRHVLLSVGGLE